MQIVVRVRASRLAIVALLAITTLDPAAGDEPARPTAPIALFDGRTLDGWKPVAGRRSGPVAVAVAVADGVLTLTAGEPMTGVTSTRADLPKTNYALSFEAKRTDGNDFFAAATFPVGSSFVTLVNGGWGGSVTGLSLINGASAAENATNHFVKYQNDVWYRFTIQVTDRVVRCLVDDREVFALDHADTQLKTRIENRANEPLGFASYRSSGAIRRVEVVGLNPDQIKEVNARVE